MNPRNVSQPVEASPIERRHFLAGALALTGALILAGCGSGGGDAVTFATRTTRGSVALPGGFSIPVGELVGATPFGQEPVGADSAFGATIAAEFPTLAFLRHAASGKFSLLGFLGAGTAGVSAKGTAVALLFLSLGYSGLPAPQQAEAITALEASPVVASLVDTIAARVAANPYAVLEGDVDIAKALKAAFDTLSTGTRAAALVAKSRAELPPIVSITPGDQSLARVLQTDNSQGVIPTNLGRRPATTYTYRIGTQTEAGRQDLVAAVRVDGPQELAPVTSWTGSLFSLGTQPAWAPVQGSPVALSMEAGASRTFFETVILMASGKTEGEGEPAFFTQPRYAGELAEWRATRDRLNKHAWFSGILFDLIKSALGGAVAALSLADVAAKIALFEQIEAEATEQVLAQAAKGAFGKATRLAMERLVGNTLLSSRSMAFVLDLTGKAESATAAALQPFRIASIIGVAELVLGVLAVGGTLLALGDLLTTYSDVLASEKGSVWQATLLKPSIALNPQTSTVPAGDSVVLSASAVAVEDGNVAVTYKWKTDNPLTNLSERDWTGSPNVGREITTTTRVVTLATTPSTQGNVTVTVEGFINGASIGTATSVIKMAPPRPLSYGEMRVQITQIQNHGIGVPSGDQFLKDYTFTRQSAVNYDQAHGLSYDASVGRAVPITFDKLVHDTTASYYEAASINLGGGTDLTHNQLVGAIGLSLLNASDVRTTDAVACDPQSITVSVQGNRVEFQLTANYYAYVNNPNRENLGYTATITVSGFFLTTSSIV